MKKKLHPVQELFNQKGAVLVLVAVLLIVFVGMAAMALDVGHLYLVRNELQNAADSGALAGARELYLDSNASTVNAGANQIAFDTAILNNSEKVAVEVNDPLTNSGDVQRGHWSFATRTFTPNSSTDAYNLTGKTEAELDADTNFVNAVQVSARRENAPAASFFARIFGYDDFALSARAVAYRGFAGNLNPNDVEQPIAICKESIDDGAGGYACNQGRMLNSGGNANTANTGGWTNFSQPCQTADANEMQDLVCGAGNPDTLQLGQGIGATGGVQDSVLAKFYDCWEAASNKNTFWNLTLPVVECPGNNVGNCAKLVGAVNLNIVWMVHKNDPHYNDVPTTMEDWNCTEGSEGFDCWKEFVDHFDLQQVTGPPRSDADYEEMYQKKNIFFLPACEALRPTGVTGGSNFGVLAQIPVLVD
jgi:Flp pilus assembly protein TadG